MALAMLFGRIMPLDDGTNISGPLLTDHVGAASARHGAASRAPGHRIARVGWQLAALLVSQDVVRYRAYQGRQGRPVLFVKANMNATAAAIPAAAQPHPGIMASIPMAPMAAAAAPARCRRANEVRAAAVEYGAYSTEYRIGKRRKEVLRHRTHELRRRCP